MNVFMVIDTYPHVAEGFSLLKIKEHDFNEQLQLPQFITLKRNVTKDPGYRIRNLAKRDWFAPFQDEPITG
jgi:hypothetical protein